MMEPTVVETMHHSTNFLFFTIQYNFGSLENLSFLVPVTPVEECPQKNVHIPNLCYYDFFFTTFFSIREAFFELYDAEIDRMFLLYSNMRKSKNLQHFVR